MMSKKTIITVLFVTSLSVIGFIFTQLFWIRNAISLSEQQFDHRVTLALKDVLAELSHRAETLPGCNREKGAPCPFHLLPANQVFDSLIVDSLLGSSFRNHSLDTNFSYRVVRCNDKSFILAKGVFASEQLPESFHRTCMSCFNKSQCFNLEVFFPGKRKFVILDMLPWLLTSLFFLLIGGLSFAFIAFTLVRQKRVSEMHSEFINNMTHEFKTPLSTISMAAEVLSKGDMHFSPDRMARYSTIILDETLRLRNQVERILQIAVLEGGQIQLSVKQVSVNQLIRNSLEHMPALDEVKQVDLRLDLQANPGLVWADPLHLTNIFTNLFDNSCKYSGETVSIRVSTQNEDKGIRIFFEDNGIGMPPDSVKLIFEKFYRVPKGNLHDVKGFGLGLYYVKTMVNAHGGTIDVTSEQGKFTRFSLFLPLNHHTS